MKFKFVLPVIILSLALAAFTAGCGSGSSDNGSTDENASEEAGSDTPIAPEDRLNVAINLSEDNLYTEKLAKELTNKLWQDGYNIILDYASGSSEKQQEQIDSLTERDIKCLIVSPVDAKTLNLDSMEENGIPVVNLDSLIENTGAVDCYIAYDNEAIGEMVGDFVISQKDPKPKNSSTIEFVIGEKTPESEAFYTGLMNKLSPLLEDGSLECRSGRTDYDSVSTTAKTPVDVYNDLGRLLSGYYINNDLDICITGADYIVNGCEAFFLSNGYSGTSMPLLTGLNGEPSSVMDFGSGFLSMTAFKDTKAEADTVSSAVKALTNGKTPDEGFDSKTDNGEKSVPSCTLEASAITAENYDSILVKSGYYSDSEIYK